MASCQDGETQPTGGGSLNNTSEKKEYIEETIQRTIRERSAHPVLRVGVGVHVLNVGDVDLKAGKFYADLQVRCPLSPPINLSALPACVNCTRMCQLYPHVSAIPAPVSSICMWRRTRRGWTDSMIESLFLNRTWLRAARWITSGENFCFGLTTSLLRPPSPPHPLQAIQAVARVGGDAGRWALPGQHRPLPLN